MGSPYRDGDGLLRRRLHRNLERIRPDLEQHLPEPVRTQIREARALGDQSVSLHHYIEATEVALALAPSVARALSELPDEVPTIPQAQHHPINERLLREVLPGRVTDIMVGEIGALAVFRCDGHPFVRRLHSAWHPSFASVELFTSIRRGVPSVDIVGRQRTRGPFAELFAVAGSRHAITPALSESLCRIARRVHVQVSVAGGLASLIWFGSLHDKPIHALAIETLIAARAVTCPTALLVACGEPAG